MLSPIFHADRIPTKEILERLFVTPEEQIHLCAQACTVEEVLSIDFLSFPRTFCPPVPLSWRPPCVGPDDARTTTPWSADFT